MHTYLHLIPYQVNAEIEAVSEVPKGIELITAPKIWEKSKGKGITGRYWTQAAMSPILIWASGLSGDGISLVMIMEILMYTLTITDMEPMWLAQLLSITIQE
jgi:hypothetical protein